MESHPKHLPADERRAATVDAVIALAGQHHPTALTTAAIAQHMGVTQGALFRHFPSKDAIWQAVMERVSDRLLGQLSRATQGRTPAEALAAMFKAHVEFAAAHPGVPRIMFGELQRAETTPAKRIVSTLLKGYRQRLKDLLERGRQDGALRADLDLDAAAALFIGTMPGLVMQSMLAGDMAAMRRTAPRVFDIYWHGIRACPEGRA